MPGHYKLLRKLRFPRTLQAEEAEIRQAIAS